MGFSTIPTRQISCYINKPNCLIIDIRSYSDYQKGHIPSAVSIPVDELGNYLYIFDQYKTVVLYCERGNASLLAARNYANHYAEVISIYGGIHAYRGELVSE